MLTPKRFKIIAGYNFSSLIVLHMKIDSAWLQWPWRLVFLAKAMLQGKENKGDEHYFTYALSFHILLPNPLTYRVWYRTLAADLI